MSSQRKKQQRAINRVVRQVNKHIFINSEERFVIRQISSPKRYYGDVYSVVLCITDTKTGVIQIKRGLKSHWCWLNGYHVWEFALEFIKEQLDKD